MGREFSAHEEKKNAEGPKLLITKHKVRCDPERVITQCRCLILHFNIILLSLREPG
jgi:hypothetical protein